VVIMKSPAFKPQVAGKQNDAIPHPHLPSEDFEDLENKMVPLNDTPPVSKSDAKRYENLVAVLKEFGDCHHQRTRVPEEDVEGTDHIVEEQLLSTRSEALDAETPRADIPISGFLKRQRSQKQQSSSARKKQKK